MPKLHVKKGDTVVVRIGKDRGKRGKVLRVLPRERKVIVEGINLVRRHTRPRPPRLPQGGIIEKAMPIDVSNVMLIDPKTDKPTRVGWKVLPDGTKVRVARRSGEQIPDPAG